MCLQPEQKLRYTYAWLQNRVGQNEESCWATIQSVSVTICAMIRQAVGNLLRSCKNAFSYYKSTIKIILVVFVC